MKSITLIVPDRIEVLHIGERGKFYRANGHAFDCTLREEDPQFGGILARGYGMTPQAAAEEALANLVKERARAAALETFRHQLSQKRVAEQEAEQKKVASVLSTFSLDDL